MSSHLQRQAHAIKVRRWNMLLDTLLELCLLTINARIIETLSHQSYYTRLWYHIQVQLSINQTGPSFGQIAKRYIIYLHTYILYICRLTLGLVSNRLVQNSRDSIVCASIWSTWDSVCHRAPHLWA